MESPALLRELLLSLHPIRDAIAASLPRIAFAVAVLAVGTLVAWALRALAGRLVRRLSSRLPTPDVEMDKGAERIVRSGVFWLTLLAALMVATEVLGLPALTTWLSAVVSFLPRVAVAAAVVLAGVIGGRLAGRATMGAMSRIAAHQARRLGRLVHACVSGAALLVAASQLGLDVSLLTAVFLITLGTALAGAAFAFGLGARSVIANILAMHYVHKTFSVGQLIRMGDDEGRIVRTTPTTVFLEHADGEIGIPGQHFADQRCVRIGRGASDES